MRYSHFLSLLPLIGSAYAKSSSVDYATISPTETPLGTTDTRAFNLVIETFDDKDYKKLLKKRDSPSTTCVTSYATTQTSSCPIWTMTFTNSYNVPTDQTGDLVTATYTDTNNCALQTSTIAQSSCYTVDDSSSQGGDANGCPIWTMTWTNSYNVPAGQTGDLVTATYTDTDNCAPATTTAANKAVKALANGDCPIWTMTWTNEYNVPAGQTGALVTATYTDTNNCAPTTANANKAIQAQVTSACKVWTTTLTNKVNGQDAATITALYTESLNCNAATETGETCDGSGCHGHAKNRKDANQLSCPIWTMTFTNQYNVPAGETGDLVTATYTDTNNCVGPAPTDANKAVANKGVTDACAVYTTTYTNQVNGQDGDVITATYSESLNCNAATETQENCITSDITTDITSCPTWTMTFTNSYNVPAGQTGDLVTATYTDVNNCATTQTTVQTSVCHGMAKNRKDAQVAQNCPIWTMTFTNEYNVPAGQTGALVTATYTDTNNCQPTAAANKAVQGQVTSACKVFTTTYTNQVNGQAGDVITAVYSESLNCNAATETGETCDGSGCHGHAKNRKDANQLSCPIWTMTFTNQYDVPAGETGALVTATYTDTNNCVGPAPTDAKKAVVANKGVTDACSVYTTTYTNQVNGQDGDVITATYSESLNCNAATETQEKCVTSDVTTDSTSCPIWTMTFTNTWDDITDDASKLITATYTDSANCQVTAVTTQTSVCHGMAKNRKDANVAQNCPIWTMTWTNEYNVPAGQTGDLVTATYTDTNNCGAASPVSTTSNNCYSTDLPTITTSCPIWTMTFTNEYNVPAGQTGDLVSATYTDTNNCQSIQTSVPTTVCNANKAAKVQKDAAADGCPIWTMTFTNQYNVPAGQTGDLVTATYTDTNNCTPTTTPAVSSHCFSTTITSQSSSCPIWTMTFTNNYNVPSDQTGDLVTATYTDVNNCVSTDVSVPTTTCVAGSGKGAAKLANHIGPNEKVLTSIPDIYISTDGTTETSTPAMDTENAVATTVADGSDGDDANNEGCPVFTMTFTNSYGVPAGQTGALVTATYTAGNCANDAKKVLTSIPDIYISTDGTTQTSTPAQDTENAAVTTDASGSDGDDSNNEGCPVFTMTFTNTYGVPSGSTGNLVTATYTAGNCANDAKKVLTSIPDIYISTDGTTLTSIPDMDTLPAATTTTEADSSASTIVDVPTNAVLAYVTGSVSEDTGDLDSICAAANSSTISVLSNNTLSLSSGELGYFNNDNLFVFDYEPSVDDVKYSGGWSVSGDYYLLLGDQSVFYVCLTDEEDEYVVFVDTDDDEGCVEAMLKLQEVSTDC
ncbi:unnamed protein product [Ambrosiozyma monospora]|uniref:Unnamed protein product n=1 Tax=Ambrosiozyma monospora TaxID=43982 RepID=A0ACB5STM1_AMBMO|nr:unnamed protein product [Ambrosiozyma monospora]